MPYTLDKSKELLIYGVRKEYLEKADTLQKLGYTILAFLDKNAKNLKINYPLYELGKEPFSKEKKQQVVVIIALQNGLQHDNISKKLYENGYKHILFLPMKYPNRNGSSYMRQAFNSFWNYGFHQLENIPDIKELSKSEDLLIIKSFEDKITLRIPIWLIFTDTNLPIVCYDAYIDLFSMLSSGKGECEEYIKLQERVGWSPEKILTDRSNLYEIYENEFNKGLEFFIDTAPCAKWNNEKQYFNLKDGHHRVVYLLMKGYTKIPINIHMEDYKKIKRDLEFLEKNWKLEIQKIGIAILRFFGRKRKKYSVLDTTVYADHLKQITKTVLSPRKENYEVLIVDNLKNLNKICKNTEYIVLIRSSEDRVDMVHEDVIKKFEKTKELFTYYSEMKKMQVEVYKKEISNDE